VLRLMRGLWQRSTRAVAAVAVLAGSFLAYRAYGWPGLALFAGAMVMWVLLHMTRMLKVLQRAADQPVGTVASAVMLHSRLAQGMTLLQVIALTRALGHCMGESTASTEQYLWTDAAGATVHCTFTQGKLAQWELMRT
jgi:hypothetical protein